MARGTSAGSPACLSHNEIGSTMCGQHKIDNGRRWVCVRLAHPHEPDNHIYVAPERVPE